MKHPKKPVCWQWVVNFIPVCSRTDTMANEVLSSKISCNSEATARHPLVRASRSMCSYGYDPLGLGKKEKDFDQYRAAELIHARWAVSCGARQGLMCSIFKGLKKW